MEKLLKDEGIRCLLLRRKCGYKRGRPDTDATLIEAAITFRDSCGQTYAPVLSQRIESHSEGSHEGREIYLWT